MLIMPSESSNIFTIIGLDPGTRMLGVAILNIDLDRLRIDSSNAFTLNADILSKDDYWTKEVHGDRFSRIASLRIKLVKIFNYYKPEYIFSESPFINTHYPAAGIALTEVLSDINRAVYEYSVWHKLHLIPPSTVKQAINAPGNANKIVMKQKILELQDLNYNDDIHLINLDEHSIDALAVGYYGYSKLMKG